MMTATMLPDFQLRELMDTHEVPERCRRWYVAYVRTGRRTKGLARVMRAAARWMPLDDNPYYLCLLAACWQVRDNCADGIVSWTTSGQPLRILRAA
jgi:hypothetical protein